MNARAPFRAIGQEQQDLRDKQIARYNYTYPSQVLVPNAGQRQSFVNVDADADFYCERITGSFRGAVNGTGAAAGIPALATAANQNYTSFPMAGTTAIPAAGTPAFPDRGLQVKITDGGSNLTLTDGYVPVECLFTPGYGVQFNIAFPYKYFIRRTAKLTFDFLNRDLAAPAEQVAAGGLFHLASVVLNGYKYLGKSV